MKKLFTILFTIISFISASSQVGNSPYPVILVHGLNSDDNTWNTLVTKLSTAWILSSSHTLNAVLNARGGDTTNYLQDVLIPAKDVSGNTVNNITSSSIYLVNFSNFWNRNISDPRIMLYNNSTPGSNQSPSNQSSIYKQGFVLKILIDSILRVTGAEKVILAGHSMGGLAIREYLQRKEDGIYKWWIDPNDAVNGHKVAKVVTIGTPHLGTNVMSNSFFTIDNNSESMRDMKYSYPSGSAGAYLFSNPESFVPSTYYTKDINCNGIVTDTITGLSFGNGDNPAMPLPVNILYTWIMSNYFGLGTDLAVPLYRQLLYNDTAVVPLVIADTLLTNKNHIQETSDVRTMVRGLDEPDSKEYAYPVAFGKLYSGYITLQSNAGTIDNDYYKFNTATGGKITVKLTSVSAGITGISLLSSAGDSLISKSISGTSDSIKYDLVQGVYFIKMTGSSSLNPSQNSYSFTPNFIPASILDLTVGIEGMWNGTSQVQDTMKVFLRNNSSPYNKIDSSASYLNNSGNALLSFIHTVSGNYYLQTSHRNALETWSSAPVNMASGVITNYDFTSAQSAAFGNNQVLISGRWCTYSGDVDNDGGIDASDLITIYNDIQIFASGYLDTDLTGDNFSDVSDLVIAFNNSSDFVEVMRP